MKLKGSASESLQNNYQKMEAENVFALTPKIKETRLLDDWVIWLEQRPNQGGRTTVLIRRWGQFNCQPQELTPSSGNIRSRLHGYGGGALTLASAGDKLGLAWVDDSNGCLWYQEWLGLQDFCKETLLLKELNEPLCLSRPNSFHLGDGLIDLERMVWLGVMEKEDKDYFVTFSLFEELQEPQIIYRAADFIGYPKLSPNAKKLAWVEWQRPDMPWDKSSLWVGSLFDFERLDSIKLLAGSVSESSRPISVFQPIWFNNDQILVSEDQNGWWNLKLLAIDNSDELRVKHKNIFNVKAESAMPQWVAGMSTISKSNEHIAVLNCKDSIWSLNLINQCGRSILIDLPFDDMSYLDANNDRAVLIASNPFQEATVVEIDLKKKSYNCKLRHNASNCLNKERISVGENLWFKGFNGYDTHSWYYPPLPILYDKSPLLVKVHSGPTGMASRGLNLPIQFWTSRGWGVLDINYAGSTGFGREYRDRLKNGWGDVDCLDCCSAVLELIKLGKASREYIAIEGSSAGGLTALGCLASSELFGVASCKYPVTDLVAMSKETHRFEAGYLDYLVGNFEDSHYKYIARSPINNAEKISTPVIFFHGLKDNVVCLDQVTKMADKLNFLQVPAELHTYENEGHGFRDAKVNIEVLELTEKFFLKHLGL